MCFYYITVFPRLPSATLQNNVWKCVCMHVLFLFPFLCRLPDIRDSSCRILERLVYFFCFTFLDWHTRNYIPQLVSQTPNSKPFLFNINLLSSSSDFLFRSQIFDIDVCEYRRQKDGGIDTVGVNQDRVHIKNAIRRCAMCKLLEKWNNTLRPVLFFNVSILHKFIAKRTSNKRKQWIN